MTDPYRTPGMIDDYGFKEVSMKINWWELGFKSLWIAFWCLLAMGLVGLVLYAPFKVIVADGRADFCFVKTNALCESWDQGKTCQNYLTRYTLMQHVPWEHDRVLATDLKSPDEVLETAKKFSCNVR